MNEKELARENYKFQLGCDDKQLDELIKIWQDNIAAGIDVSFDAVVNGISNFINDPIWMNGTGIGEPIGILSHE